MENNTFVQEQQEIFIKLRAPVSSGLAIISEYINSFDKTDFFSFADKSKKADIYKKEYHAVVFKLSPHVSEISELISVLSTLFINAERSVDPSASLLEEIFNSYLAFESELLCFYSKTEKLLKASEPSVSEMTLIARRLEVTAKALLEKIS